MRLVEARTGTVPHRWGRSCHDAGVALILLVLLGVLLLLGAAVALSFADGGLRDEQTDYYDLGMPDRALTADDIPGLRFRTGIRGYRMEDVDAALDRIAQTLRSTQPPPTL
jgi:DivIVA domain-containing protein